MAIAVKGTAQVAGSVTTTQTVTKPGGAGAPASGDVLVAILARSQDSPVTAFVGSSGGTWTSRGLFAANASTVKPPIGILTRTATGSEPASYSFTSTGATASDQFHVILLVCSGVDASNPLSVTPAATDAASNATSLSAPSVTIPSGLPDYSLMLSVWAAFKYNATTNAYGWTPPGTMTELGDIGFDWLHWAVAGEQRTTGATGTRTANFILRSNSSAQTTQNPGRGMTFALRPGVTSVAPTVGAGSDVTVDQYDEVSITPTEDNGGAAITSRAWTVVSGPNEVGATIGTSAVLSWFPTVGGSYVIRYAATNSQGTGTDDVAVTVNALNFPVTGAMLLGASAPGAKHVESSRTANLPLGAARVGAKAGAFAPTAALHLGASAEGMKINLVIAPLRIQAALLNAGSSLGSYPIAPLKLAASVSGRQHVADAGSVAAPLALLGATEGTTHREGVVTASMLLAASPGVGSKLVGISTSAGLGLAASIADVLHANGFGPNAELKIAASTSDRSSTRNNVNRTAPLKLKAQRVATSVHFGHPATIASPLRLGASVFVQRIVEEATPLRPRADTTVKYEVVAVARVPQVAGPPTFLEVDPIDWTSITHNQVLNSPDSMSVEVKIERLTESVLQRLRTPHELPTEIWVRRNGKQVFAGPLLAGRVSSESLSLEAQGLEAYTKMWYVQADLNFLNTDQFSIIKSLVDQWQALDYGNYGIDTSQVTTSGVLRTLNLPAAELHTVFDRIDDFTEMSDGLDWSIDPASRRLELYSPSRGIDRSAGEDAIIFDQRNVTSADLAFSIAPGDLASDGLATGTATGSDTPLLSTFSNLELRARYGRTGVTANFQSPDQGALDAAIQALVQARGAVLLIPGPNTRVTLDSDLSSYDVGDIIGYQAHSRLSVSGAYRVRKRSVRVAETGTESVSLEFV